MEIVHGEGDVGVEAERGGGELARVAPAAEVAHDDAVCRRRDKKRALPRMITWCKKEVRLKSSKLPSSLWQMPTRNQRMREGEGVRSWSSFRMRSEQDSVGWKWNFPST